MFSNDLFALKRDNKSSITELFILVCMQCRRGHVAAELPAREGTSTVSTPCPYCFLNDPGWSVWTLKANYFMDVSAKTSISMNKNKNKNNKNSVNSDREDV